MLLLILSMEDPIKRDIVLDLYFNYHKRAIAAVIPFIHDHYTAEEIVYDVFAEIIEDPSKLKRDTAKKNWPYVETAVKNKAKNYMRDNKKVHLVEDYSEVEFEAQSYQENVDLEELLVNQDILRLVWEEVLKLPEIYRTAVYLRYEHQFEDEEISQLLNISVSNVRVRLHRAARMLEQRLKTKLGGE